MTPTVKLITNKITKKIKGDRKYLISKIFWNCDIHIISDNNTHVIKSIEFMANQERKKDAVAVAQYYKQQILTNIHLYVK